MGHNGNQVTRLRAMLEKVSGMDSGFALDCLSFSFAALPSFGWRPTALTLDTALPLPSTLVCAFHNRQSRSST